MELDRLFRSHLELVGHLYSRLDVAKGKSSKIVDAVAPAVFQIFRFRGLMQVSVYRIMWFIFAFAFRFFWEG